MKKIVKFQIVENQGHLTLDHYNPEIRMLETEELCNIYLPYTRIFESIRLKNFIGFPKELIARLTNQYTHGAKIEIVTPSKNFAKIYQLKGKAKPFYTYRWEELDLTKPIPRSLAQFQVTYKGIKTTYLEAMKQLTSTRYLPNELWTALDSYSRSMIDKCRAFNQTDYSQVEDWYKELQRDCIQSDMFFFSPNAKTFFETIAELDFEKACEEAQLPPDEAPLTEQELAFLHHYASAYGIEIPKFSFRVNTRNTEHGYTQEPEHVIAQGMSKEDWTKVSFDARNASKQQGLPKEMRQGLVVREYENSKLLKEAYFQLKWLIDNLGDEALMPNWHRCPECGELYREHEGCSCGACRPIQLIQADNLLYGISSTYEDYEGTQGYYSALLSEELA